MSDRPPSHPSPGIDEAIARFRAAMVDGRASIDPDECPTPLDPDQASRLSSLLEAELRSRIDCGDIPTPADYLGRFGPLDQILRDVFLRLDRSLSLDSTDGSVDADPRPMISTATRSPSGSAPPPDTDPDRTRTAPGHAFPPIPPAALDADAWIGREIGDYRILARIGRGGMGQVFRAEHRWLRKPVALKLLPPDRLDPATIARFEREMEAVGRLEHPNIVRCTDARKVDGVPLLVLELIDGVDLGALTRRLGRLPIPEACALILQAATGLQHAFERGLVHRDIKPSNLMLDRAGTLKVLDLGLALILDPSASQRGLTESRQVVGTFDYTAPEQWDNSHAVDIRADLYSLGCTLHHLLVGSPPFGGPDYSTAVRKMRAHLHEPPPPLRGSRPDVPDGLAEVVHRLLAKDPAERFDTPSSLIRELAPLTAGADLLALIHRFDSDHPPAFVPPAEPTPTPPDDPPRPIVLDEDVQFTVYRPKVIAPEIWYPLLVFAHLSDRPIDAPEDQPDPVEEVRRQAEQVLGPRSRDFQPTTQDASQAVPREELLTIVPEVPGLQFNPPRRSFRWVEPVHREEFRLRALSPTDGSTLRGRISIFLGSILLAEVPISIRVDASRRADRVRLDQPTAARPFRKIYASYSDRDRPIVGQVERYARMLGDSFIDRCSGIRCGEVWDDRLRDLIGEADVFQLFWSRNAMDSPLVEHEWKHALDLGRPQFIRPVYWEEPLPSDPARNLPPTELLRLAFHRLDQAEVPRLAADPPEVGAESSLLDQIIQASRGRTLSDEERESIRNMITYSLVVRPPGAPDPGPHVEPAPPAEQSTSDPLGLFEEATAGIEPLIDTGGFKVSGLDDRNVHHVDNPVDGNDQPRPPSFQQPGLQEHIEHDDTEAKALGPREEDSDFELTPPSVIDALQPESGSDFELTTLDASDEFDAAAPRPGDSDVTGAEPLASGVNLGRPSDSGINLQQMGSLNDADSIELAPIGDDDDRPAPKPKAAPRPAAERPDPSATAMPGLGAGSDPSATALPVRDQAPQKDIFEDTDFEVDALGSSRVAPWTTGPEDEDDEGSVAMPPFSIAPMTWGEHPRPPEPPPAPPPPPIPEQPGRSASTPRAVPSVASITPAPASRTRTPARPEPAVLVRKADPRARARRRRPFGRLLGLGLGLGACLAGVAVVIVLASGGVGGGPPRDRRLGMNEAGPGAGLGRGSTRTGGVGLMPVTVPRAAPEPARFSGPPEPRAVALAELVGPNLILNPGFEETTARDGPPAGATDFDHWERLGSVALGSHDDAPAEPVAVLEAPDLGSTYAVGGLSESRDDGRTMLRQAVDVSELADRIDAGRLRFDASAWLGGVDQTRSFDPNDAATLTVRFLDATAAALPDADASLGPIDDGLLQSVSPGTPVIARVSRSGPVPSGTRAIAFELAFDRRAGEVIDAIADELRFSLEATP